MSLWDNLKPAKKVPVVTAADLGADQQTLTLTWSDGLSSKLTARLLRQACPCAGCVDEMTGKRTLDVNAVPQDMTITDVAPVGNYALCFTFADAHKTGLYHWEYLRELCARAQ